MKNEGMAAPPAFRALVAARRDDWNRRFVRARERWPRLTGEVVLAALGSVLAPVAEALAETGLTEAVAATDRLYDVMLEMAGRGLIGPGSRRVDLGGLWGRVLAGVPELTVRAPERVGGAVANALARLAGERDTRPELWVQRLCAAARYCPEVETLLACGTIAGWQAGLAQYRRTALATARTLPPSAVAAVLGLPLPCDSAGITAVLDRLNLDPWHNPGHVLVQNRDPVQNRRSPRIVTRVGGFRGFGGPFLTPPRLTLAEGGFVASDHEAAWDLFADAFGATLVRRPSFVVAPVAETPGREAASLLARLQRLIPELAGASVWAANRRTAAVVPACSHAVVVVMLE
ncbi:conserved hypothetical protein [uncultured Gammaproteobacteria bacterium]